MFKVEPSFSVGDTVSFRLTTSAVPTEGKITGYSGKRMVKIAYSYRSRRGTIAHGITVLSVYDVELVKRAFHELTVTKIEG